MACTGHVACFHAQVSGVPGRLRGVGNGDRTVVANRGNASFFTRRHMHRVAGFAGAPVAMGTADARVLHTEAPFGTAGRLRAGIEGGDALRG